MLLNYTLIFCLLPCLLKLILYKTQYSIVQQIFLQLVCHKIKKANQQQEVVIRSTRRKPPEIISAVRAAWYGKVLVPGYR